MSIRVTSSLCLLVIGLTVLPCARPAHAQLINFAQQGVPGDPGLELLQEEPHDLIFKMPDFVLAFAESPKVLQQLLLSC